MIKRIRNYFRFLNTFDELNRLSNRELRDIGLTRSDVYRVSLDSSFYRN